MSVLETERLLHGFRDVGLDAVWCAHYVWNAQSRRVIEKCGFRHQFTRDTVNLLGVTNQTVFYAIKRQEYTDLWKKDTE